MRGARRKALFRLHAWIGSNLGLLLFAICLSGTVAVFSAELHWLVDPSIRVQKPAGGKLGPMSWQVLYDRVAQAHPHAQLLSLHAPHADGFPAAAIVAYTPQDFRTILIDPHSGAIKGHRGSFGLTSFLRIFHKQLYVVPTIFGIHGTLIVGALAIALLLASIAGLLSITRWWRTLFVLRNGRSPRLFWSDLHRAAGIWSLLVSILLSLTGIWYLAENLLHSGKLLQENRPPPRLSASELQRHPAQLAMLDLDRAVEIARDAFPQMHVSQIRLPVRPADALSFSGEADAWLVRDRSNAVAMDPYTGRILQVRRAADLNIFPRWIETADPLHFGTFGGLATRVIWLIAGIALCGGMLAGLYGAWLRLRRHDVAAPRSRRAAALAVLPTFILLLASIYGTWAYGGALARLSQHPATVRPLGQIELGGRMAAVFVRESAGKAAVDVEIVFGKGAWPNVRHAALSLGGRADSEQLLPVRRQVDRLSARLPAPACAAACQLTMTIEEWDGARPMARVEIGPGTASRATTLPAAQGMSAGEMMVMAIFILCLLLPFLGWVMLQFVYRPG